MAAGAAARPRVVDAAARSCCSRRPDAPHRAFGCPHPGHRRKPLLVAIPRSFTVARCCYGHCGSFDDAATRSARRPKRSPGAPVATRRTMHALTRTLAAWPRERRDADVAAGLRRRLVLPDDGGR